MKKYIIITALSLAAVIKLGAQDYKIAKSTGKLIINLPSAIVEGYDGNEIVFSSQRSDEEMDPRAKGLRAINGSGFTDNTGLGISVTDKGTSIEVNQVSHDLSIKIRVPKGIIVSFACHKVENAGTVQFRNMQNEIEIATDYNKVELENITGPITVTALYGSVDASFIAPIKGPVSIASIYSTVDVSIPVDTKANVKLNSSHGSILASAEFKIEIEKNENSDMVSYGSIVNGKLNGGGAEFKLSAEYGKIYLRKSK
jgi:Putative adhesin